MTHEQAATRALILVVDDNPVNVDLLSRRLERDGYRVVTRDNAVSLEADLVSIKPDVVLLDWMMPERSGIEALRGIRETRDSNRLPVIMVTALGDSASVSAAIEAGANDYLTKPIDFAVLRARLAGVIDRRLAVQRQDEQNAALEMMVAKRTAELQQANERLIAEIEVRRDAEQRAVHFARTDALTRLPNRLLFMERLRQLATGTAQRFVPFSIIYVDIDRFRSINTIHGPETGDAVLVEMARRLCAMAENHEIVARLAADEFALITKYEDAPVGDMALASHLHAQLSKPMEVCGRHIAPSLSVAVAHSGPSPTSEVAILLECDAALRQAQKRGGGQVCCFDEALDQAIRESVLIKNELALGIPRGEIVPHYQPTICFATGGVVGAEVLARWHHPTRGLVSPGVFIPVAEETGQVDDIFWALLPRACAEAQRVSPSVSIALNLSPSQVLDKWFPHKVLKALAAAGLPPSRLEIEMTETALFSDLPATRGALEGLRNQGVRVALDDFGVGFSSLSLLRDLPITKVKIDQSFVSGIVSNPSAASLVKGVISLCDSLGLATTAEGIEDPQVADLLAQWGCKYGQGYLLGRPAAELAMTPTWVSAQVRNAA